MGKNYIPQIVRVKSEILNELSIDDALENFLAHSQQRVLLILGTSGIGKSLCLEHIKNYNVKNNISTKLINLNTCSEKTIIKGKSLKKKLENTGWSTSNTFLFFFKSSNIRVLLLDGQDELKGRVGLVNIYQTNELNEWENLKVIITCRKEILPPVYHHFFSPNEGDLVEWQLLPFNKTQQFDYINALIAESHSKYAQLNTDHCQSFLNKIPIEIAGNPLLLNFCLLAISSLPKEKNLQLSHYQIYHLALKKYFLRETQEKRILIGISLGNNLAQDWKNYAQEMALNMWVNHAKTIPMQKWSSDLFSQAQKNLTEKKSAYKKEITFENNSHCLLITQDIDDNQVYQFQHTSIQEYFVASWLLNYLYDYSKQDNPDFNILNHALSIYNITPTVLLSDESVLSFLSDVLNTDEGALLKKILNQMILATRHNHSLAPLGALAITLLNYIGENFSYCNLQRISIRGAILRFSCCYATLFQYSDLSQVDFQGADLTLANLQYCIMEKVQFGELTLMQVEEGIYQFSHDSKKLLIGTYEGKVQVLNLLNNQKEADYCFDKSRIKQLCWDAKEKIILSLHDNANAYLIDQKRSDRVPIAVRYNSNKKIKCLALSVNQHKKLIAVAYDDGLIQLLQYENNLLAVIYLILPSPESINFITFNQNSQIVASDNKQMYLYHFSEKNYQLIKHHQFPQAIDQFHFNNDSKNFITIEDELIHLWDIQTCNLINTFGKNVKSIITSVEYDSKFLVAGDNQGNLFIWHLVEPTKPLARIGIEVHTGIKNLQFSAKDNLIISTNERGKIIRTKFRFNENPVIRKMPALDHSQGFWNLIDFSPDGKYFAITHNNTLYFYETNTWKFVKEIKTDLDYSYSCHITNQTNITIVMGGHYQAIVDENKKEYWLSNIINGSAFITSDEKYFICNNELNIVAWHLKKEKAYPLELSGMPFKNISNIVYCLQKKHVVFASNLESNTKIIFVEIKNVGNIEQISYNDCRFDRILISQRGNFIVAEGKDKNFNHWLYCIDYIKKNVVCKLNVDNDGLVNIVINKSATLIIGTSYVKPVLLIWELTNNKLEPGDSILHPDRAAQIFLFETLDTLKIISKSYTGTIRVWEAPNTPPYKFRLTSENGHFILLLKNTQISGAKELSPENLLLLHQRGAKDSLILEEERLEQSNTPLDFLFRIVDKLKEALKHSYVDINRFTIEYNLKHKGLSYTISKAHQNKESEENLLNKIKVLSKQTLGSFLNETLNKESQGFQALHWCAALNYSDLAQHLLVKGFKKQLHDKNSMGLTPMQTAVVVGSHTFFMNCFERIPEFSELSVDNERIKVSLNELHLALAIGQIDIVKDIFSTFKKNNTKINLEVNGIGNLLHLIVYTGCHYLKYKSDGTDVSLSSKINAVDLLRFILQQDFSKERLINLLTEAANNYEKLSPLSLAAKYGHIGLVNALINCIKNYVEESNGLGEVNKAFYVAAAHGQNEVVELFINFYHFKPSNLHLTYLETIELIKEKGKTESHYQLILGSIQKKEKESAHHHYIAPQTSNQTYENLVFAGGGNGFIFSYALQTLERNFSQRSQSVVHDFIVESLSLKAIKRVAGSSVGALVAFTLAIGCLPHELEKLLAIFLVELLEEEELERMCLQLELTYPNVEEILAVATKELLEQINLLRKQVRSNVGSPSDLLQDTWTSSQHPLVIYEKVKDIIIKLKQLNAELKGLSTGEKAYDFLKQLLTRKGLAETLTFGELADLVSQNTQQHQGYKHLHITVTNLTQNISEVLSSENGLYKNYIILDVIRASMVFPILFSPHHLRIKEGKQIKTLADDYIDGSLLRPYLLDEFDFKQYTDTDYSGDPKYPVLNKSTLGICFKPQEPIKQENQSETLLSRFMEWVNLTNQAVALISAQVDQNCHRSIMLDVNHLPSVTLNPLNDQEKLGLKQQADKAVGNFFKVELSKVNNPVPKTSPRFFASAKASANPRQGLKNEAKLSEVLQPYLPQELALGKAYAQGDCFFDALAQCLNRINNTYVNSDKYLRMLCHEYYGKNKALVDKLNARDYGGIDKHDDYFMVQYTADDCNKDFGGRSPIWGRPYVEGIILCNQLKLRGLCIIEILEHPETKQSIPSFHWVNQESYTSISESEAREKLNNPEIPTLVVEQNSLHFVPLLYQRSNKYLLSSFS